MPLAASVGLLLALALGILEAPLWVLVLAFFSLRMVLSLYNNSANANNLVAINPLQLRLTLMDRDFTEAGMTLCGCVRHCQPLPAADRVFVWCGVDYEMLLALDECTPSVSHDKLKRIDAAISSLALDRVSSDMLGEFTCKGKQTCSICLDEFAIGDEILTLRCGHCFHSGELENWLRRKPRCPVCVQELEL
jgi:hypothetical protein